MSEWMKWLLLGMLSVAFGIFVLGNTVVATIAVTTLTGALLLVSGIFQVIGGFTSAETLSSRIFGIMMGLVMGFLGISFLFNPLEGAISLTMLVMLLLAAGGLLRIYYAWRMRDTPYFWLMLLSGALSVLLAAFILLNFATATMTLLGVLLGIELLMNGISLIVIAFAIRKYGSA